MQNANIGFPELIFTGKELIGAGVANAVRRLGDLKGVFEDEAAFAAMNPGEVVYRVSSVLPVAEGTPGGLYMGITTLMPGKVGDEYFMTKGHFHACVDRAEFYWGVEGEGMLILMDAGRRIRAERMFPGSLHYIPGGVAHRVANVGGQPLVFAASWPSDAGHDYDAIARDGFALRLKEVGGRPALVRAASEEMRKI